MLDDIIEIVLEIVFEIIGEVLGDTKLPKPIRIGLSIIVLALVFGACGIVIGLGIRDANMLLVGVGTGLLVLFGIAAIYLVRKHKKRMHF